MWQHHAQGRPRVFGHRGAMGYAPENTFASFERAVALGVDAIELDVHLSADGQVVVIHDPDLSRTTNGQGMVSEHPLAVLERLDAGHSFDPAYTGQRIPTLDETLAWARGRVVLDIEIKGGPAPYPGIAEKVVELIRKHGMVDQTIVISFDHPTVKRVKEVAPDQATGTLYSCRPVDPVAVARAASANAILPHWSYCHSEDVERAHAAGLSVHPWATSAPEVIAALVEMGVDSVCSNHPDRVVQVLGG
ncbi:MAG: glycerophosphodiester phosphodiesterase [Chloroflexi bacterium]|nr:glycerophosphodiester phosphodiesterase [Chloroflexota bacterium]